MNCILGRVENVVTDGDWNAPVGTSTRAFAYSIADVSYATASEYDLKISITGDPARA